MDHELLCNWLGLATKTWPPDHYTLLGLDPREADCAQIEQRVHEQLARIRCYQLSHPALATEAMNRLAQALLCLTDRDARKAYDAQVLPNRLPRVENPPPVRALKPKTQAVTRTAQAVVDQPPAQAQTPASSNVDTAVVPPKQTQVDWKDATPPPVRTVTPAPPPVANPTPASPPAAAEQQPPPPAAPAA
ncbi:MAG TPA: hypothetical protein VEL76_41490, partial [Gemmataceae bacterium]|nr:hypothetical protein [Gemmataceae bacterium]